MSRVRRVAVMSPQTRLAHSRRRSHARSRVPLLQPVDAERAAVLYRVQRRRGVLSLVLIFALLFGLPLLFQLAPGLDSLRLWGIPLSWLMIAILPYPVMALLARWQLRRAERVEDSP
ncbi:hypothetical protein [Amycolatopsis sp. H20-H5]|uniref:hypothetical protein n=1 Tax=Amycolatopsis sp. H20-H5 TaxID=3046309 RepID=UPI002DBCBFF3|nr:hypothetical protein [Amycolatopsis sp. H20-H5]MEC3980331.1 hypothetical protein [Amycolatopsis sp. H20-H5]